jgi:hypothetical protein
MRGRLKDLGFGLTGELNVTLSLAPSHADELKKLAGEDLDIEIEKRRDRRSQNANSYLWVLVSQIAEKMFPAMSKEEVYHEMLKRYGQGTSISVLTSRLPEVKRELDHYEEIGKGTINGKEFTHLRMWIGSSKYNTKEMSVLLDGIVEEAKELNIETLTPDELKKMTEAWNG